MAEDETRQSDFNSDDVALHVAMAEEARGKETLEMLSWKELDEVDSKMLCLEK